VLHKKIFHTIPTAYEGPVLWVDGILVAVWTIRLFILETSLRIKPEAATGTDL
jgi:hypothetical protein